MISLDVDGVLIPFHGRPVRRRWAADEGDNPLLDRLEPDDGPRLLRLGGDLIRATTAADFGAVARWLRAG